jgi:hypothetical protein
MGRQTNNRGKNPRDAVSVGGREWIPYGGILDIAHEKGLKGIDTRLLQVPDEKNGNVAIVRAEATSADGGTFSGIGDASPENVARNIVPHIIRQAETRAKARALGDMVNRANVDEASGEQDRESASNITHLKGAAKTVKSVWSGKLVAIKSAKEAKDFVEKNRPENPGEAGGGATGAEIDELQEMIREYQELSHQTPDVATWEERNLGKGKNVYTLTSDEVKQFKFVLENLIGYLGRSGEEA